MNHPDKAWEIRRISPWGSMGNILIHGFLWDEHFPDVYELVRTGPFVPPISFPSGYCAITDAVKEELKTMGFSGVELSELPLGKVVESDWHLRDRTQDFDYSLVSDDDEISESEDLILVPEHCPDMAKGMPKMWLLRGVQVHFEWESYSDDLKTLSWTQSELNGWDFCSPSDSIVFVSQRAKAWLQDRYGTWVEFEEFPIVE